jgi:hypothetical protein
MAFVRGWKLAATLSCPAMLAAGIFIAAPAAAATGSPPPASTYKLTVVARSYAS